jgi:hypothetical protein
MAFRADEAARVGYENVEAYLVPRPRDANEVQRARSKQALLEILDELGPVVDQYPAWHPLVCNQDSRQPITIPGGHCGYKGLDHTSYFAHGFITCPYGDGQDVLDSIAALPKHHIATITAERLDVQLYSPRTKPILVKCEWHESLDTGAMIPLSIALPMILEQELPHWRSSEVGETWETMRPYFLGRPHGSRSSLFVSQETGQTIKKIWESLINTGMFGPVKY